MNRKTLLVLFLAALFALALAACGGDDSTAPADDAAQPAADESAAVAAGDPAQGAELYVASCSACHGPDAKGLPNLGKDLTVSTFVSEKSDAELLAFVKTGRPAGDPLNTTGIDMPPKGGNPALTDEQILDIIAHLREIHE